MIITGDCLNVLPELESSSAHCCITSPPYYGLRSYGLGAGELGHEALHDCQGWATGFDKACGACYVCHLVQVFAQVKRVLRADGTLWLVLGDSRHMHTRGAGGPGLQHHNKGSILPNRHPRLHIKLAEKNLLGIPWRVALALQADGWVLRQSIIWAKPNPMPEPATDRCARSHEYVLLLSQQRRYFFDAQAIRLPKAGGHRKDVWTLPVKPFSAKKLGFEHTDHYAAFPEALVEPMVLAATSEAGVCQACGAPLERRVQRGKSYWELRKARGETGSNRPTLQGLAPEHRMSGSEYAAWKAQFPDHDQGFKPTCSCQAGTAPAVVLDPFAGSGTTLLVAERLGRQALGIEANPDYVKIVQARLEQGLDKQLKL